MLYEFYELNTTPAYAYRTPNSILYSFITVEIVKFISHFYLTKLTPCAGEDYTYRNFRARFDTRLQEKRMMNGVEVC